MLSAILLVLAGWAAQAPQTDDVGTLEEQVRALTSQDLYDAALEALKKFAAAHPALADESRVKRLLGKTQDLAQEADRLFKSRMDEARAHFDARRYPKTLETTGL